MRFLLVILCALAASASPALAASSLTPTEVSAPTDTPCVMQEFYVTFPRDRATLTEAERADLAHNLERARQCSVLTAFVVSHRPDQAEALRADMAALGVPEQSIVVTQLNARVGPQGAAFDSARVTIVFR